MGSTKTSCFSLKLSRCSKYGKRVVANLALKALEIVCAWKQKFYICNQKEMKLATNPDCIPFIQKV